MAFIEGSNDGALDGTTAVTLVPAPSAGRRVVRSIYVSNVDTAQVTLTVRLNNNGTFRRIEPAYVLPINGLWLLPHPIVLDSATESIEALLGGAPAANQPEFVASFADVS